MSGRFFRKTVLTPGMVALMAIVTALLYLQVLKAGFVLDDVMVITENSFVKQGVSGIPEILSNDAMTGYMGKQPNLLEGGRYRPLSLVFFAVGYDLFGEQAAWFHIFNLLWYLLSGILLYILLAKLFKGNESNRRTLFLAASVLLFMVHPIHTEVVCNIKGADELLSLMFGLAGWIFVLRWSDRKSFANLVLVWLFLFLSFMAKESSLPLVAAIPLSLIYFRNFTVKKSLSVAAYLLVPVVIYLAFRQNALGFFLSGEVKTTGIMNNPYVEATVGQKYSTILFTLLLYLKLLFVPHPLTHDYYPWQVPLQSPSDLWVWVAVLVTGGLVWFAIRGWKQQSPFSFAILYFFITLSIVSNVLVNVGTLMNERFLFIPSVAFPILIFWLLNRFFPEKKGFMLLAMALVAVTTVTFAWLTWRRVPDWNNTMSLNRSAIGVSKNSARANLFYGVALFNDALKPENDSLKANLLTEAGIHIDRALHIYPEYRDALNMKAGVAAEIWKSDKSLPALLKAFDEVMSVRAVPFVEEFTDWLMPRSDPALMVPFLYRVGYDHLARGQRNFPEALKYLKKGHQLAPSDPKILFGLCVVSHLSGNYREAILYGEQFTRMHGENAEILLYSGRSMVQTGQVSKGNQYLEQAYQLKPELKNLK